MKSWKYGVLSTFNGGFRSTSSSHLGGKYRHQRVCKWVKIFATVSMQFNFMMEIMSANNQPFLRFYQIIQSVYFATMGLSLHTTYFGLTFILDAG